MEPSEGSRIAFSSAPVLGTSGKRGSAALLTGKKRSLAASPSGPPAPAPPSLPPLPTLLLASAAELPAVPSPWRAAAANLTAGALAGSAVEAALYPLDTLKTRLQAAQQGGGLRALVRRGGGRALYAGVWGNLAGVAPASAVFMAVYEPVRRLARERWPQGGAWAPALAGGVAAGLAASVVRVPTEVVKTRVQTLEFAGALQALRGIVAAQGVRGLYAGYGSFLLRDLPFDAVEFVAYEQLKRAWRRARKGRELAPYEHSVLGAAAGVLTGALTTPLDVVKTRLMAQGTAARYRGAAHALRTILREEGAAGLMRGWQPRVLWIGIGGSVFFTALELAQKALLPAGHVRVHHD